MREHTDETLFEVLGEARYNRQQADLMAGERPAVRAAAVEIEGAVMEELQRRGYGEDITVVERPHR